MVSSIYLDNTYMAFNSDNECITVKDNIEHVIKNGLQEFPNCRVVKKGIYASGKYVSVECSEGHVITSSYIAFNNIDSCNKYIKLDNAEQDLVFDGK